MLVGYILKILYRKPFIVVLHWEYKIFEEGCLRSLKRKKSIFKSLLLLVISVFIRKIIFPKVDHCFTTTNVIKNYAANQLKLQHEKISISGNAVDSDKFKPYAIEKRYDVAYFGRNRSLAKRCRYTVKAWKLVVTWRPSKLVLIGGFNSQRDYKELANLLSELCLKNYVEVTGFIEDEEIVKLLSMSRVFVFPTRFDGFSLTPLEAMSCGLPSIISEIPTMKEVYGEVAVFAEKDKRLWKEDINIFEQ